MYVVSLDLEYITNIIRTVTFLFDGVALQFALLLLLFFSYIVLRVHWLSFFFFYLRIALRNQIEENFIISSSERRQ